jgi:glycosyltransferase involved in cell wall biosynthesis
MRAIERKKHEGTTGYEREDFASSRCSAGINELPKVSVIIPCRNEERFIGRCLDSIIANDYPKDKLEILVVDGMSEDRSAEFVRNLAKDHPSVHLLENPQKITPAAFNIGIRKARGQVILIASAHSSLQPHHIRISLELLSGLHADVVGGPVRTIPASEKLADRAIAQVLSHRFGVGNSRFRTDFEYEGPVDTVPFGAYQRDVFERFGMFDETLSRNQDNEFHSRILRKGGSIFSSPRLTALYYGDSGVGRFCRHAWRAGFWNACTLFSHPGSLRIRHFIPAVFALLVITGGVLSLLGKLGKWLLAAIGLSYLAGAVTASLQIVFRQRHISMLVLPAFFATYHFSYGVGSLVGFFSRGSQILLRKMKAATATS